MKTNSVDNPQNVTAINLVDSITMLLESHGHQRPSDWINSRHFSQDIYRTGDDPKYQLFLVNRAWLNILCDAKTDTWRARYCLVEENITHERWLQIFEQGVIPCIIANDLPPGKPSGTSI